MKYNDGVALVRKILESVVNEQQFAIGGGIVGGAEAEADIQKDMDMYIMALDWFDDNIIAKPNARATLDKLPKHIQDKINDKKLKRRS